ncbi:Cuticular protein 64Ac [Carabus blaptoides fortunei]
MAFKFVVFCAVVVTARAGYLNGGIASLTLGASRSPIITSGATYSQAQPVLSSPALPAPGYAPPAAVAIHAPSPAPPPAPIPHVAITTRVEPYDPNPQYAYSYDVNDYVTGDSKSQDGTSVYEATGMRLWWLLHWQNGCMKCFLDPSMPHFITEFSHPPETAVRGRASLSWHVYQRSGVPAWVVG